MAEKKRSRLIDYLVYLTVRILVCVLQALPFDAGCAFARFLGWVLYTFDKRHRQSAIESLNKAFPGQYSDGEIDAMVRHVYAHFCTIIVEFIHLPRRLHLHNYKRYITQHEPGRMIDVLLSGRPVLFVTGHFGNWEMAGYALAMFGVHAYTIARPIDNPYLDEFLRSFRERTGQKMLAKKGDFAQIESILAGGGVLAALADQDAGPRGLFVDFFGRPASTHKAVALLSIEHKVPMIVMGAPKRSGRYHITTVDVIFPEDYENDPDAIRAITQRFTTELESLIRQAPEQYFWLHRRWKHAPPVRKKKSVAA